MAAHLKTCAQLDRSIRQESQTRTIFDPEVRRLRAALRAEGEAALLADYRTSLKHDVEQLLWKAVFYRPIEEFRRRIKQAEGDLKAKTELAFQAYLRDAQAFYLQLAAKLQQRYGDAGFPQALAAQHLQALGQEVAAVEAAPQPQDCRASVHRCLICLGDLARYGASVLPAPERDWAACRHFYLQASHAYPEGGNSYNQLAVLATYEGDPLSAAFHYCRALAAPKPFPVARENLVTHFEQNRLACLKLGDSTGGGGGGGGQWRGMRPASQALKELQMRRVPVYDLEDQLQRLRQQGRKAAAVAAAGEQPPLLLQVAATAAYTAHLATSPPLAQQQASSQGATAGTASFAAAAQLQHVKALALLLLFSTARRLASAAAAALAAKPQQQQDVLGSAAGLLLLPPLRLLFQWLAAAGPDVLLPPKPTQQRIPQRQQGQGELAELTAARQQLWEAAAELLAALRQVSGEAAVHAGVPHEVQHVVLPEDAQLAGFRHVSPALPAGSGAAAIQPSAAAAPEVQAARVHRIWADSAAIAAVLVGGRSLQVPAALAAAHEAFIEQAGSLPQSQLARTAEALLLPQQQQQQQGEQGTERAAPGIAAGQPEARQDVATKGAPLPHAALAAQAVPQTASGGAGGAAEEALEVEEEEIILYSPVPAALGRTVSPVPQSVPQPVPRPQQQPGPSAAAAPATGGQALGVHADSVTDTDMEHVELMGQTAQAVAGSVLPEADRQPSPPPVVLASQAAQQRQAAEASAQQQQQQQQQPAVLPGEGVRLPPEFFSLFGQQLPQQQPASQPQYQQQQYQQQQYSRGQGLSPVSAASLAAGQQQQQAAGLRALLFGGAGGGGSGGGGGGLPLSLGGPMLAPPQQRPGPALGYAPTAAATATDIQPGVKVGAGDALLSSASAADRWAWMGAFVGGGGSGGETAHVARPAAASSLQPQQHLRTDNPFVP
ncbi:hypothetical protein ACK3TF_005514 [Chlorella vulgaris]